MMAIIVINEKTILLSTNKQLCNKTHILPSFQFLEIDLAKALA